MIKTFDFTIIITTYNSEKFIEKCIKSVLNQRYDLQQIEMIIIDDVSTDCTIEKIVNLNLENSFGMYHLLSTEVNSGPGAARNIGISKHKGSYVIFIDSDDEILPNALSELSAHTSTMADLIFFDSIRRYVNGEEVRYCKHEKSLSNELNIKLKTILSLESDDHVIHSAYKSSLLLSITPFKNGFFEDIRFQAHAILEAKSISHICNPIYLKHSHSQQITSFMDFDKAIQYLECRISLHEELLFQYNGLSKDIEDWSNYGLRGAISLAVNKMKNFYADENEFNLASKKVLKFLSNRISNLKALFTHDLRTNLDYQAKLYYDTYRT